MKKTIDQIHNFLTKNKLIGIFIILLTVGGGIHAFWTSGNTTIDDRDIVDNKGAVNPITNIDITQIQNPKPENRLSYEVISLNEKVDELYHSKFRLSVTVPQGGSFSFKDELGVSLALTCMQSLSQKGNSLGGSGIGGSINGGVESFSYQLIECTSEKKIIDDGNLFFVINI